MLLDIWAMGITKWANSNKQNIIICKRSNSQKKQIQTKHSLSVESGESLPYRTYGSKTINGLNEIAKQENKNLDLISKFDPEFAETIRPTSVTIEEIQDALKILDEKTVFLEFFVTSEQTNVFMVWQNGMDVVELPDFTENDVLLNLYPTWIEASKFLRNKSKEHWFYLMINLLNELARKCWNHIQKKLDKLNATNLIIAPHSALHLLPFHLIPITSTTQAETYYLIDRYNISCSPSYRMLRFCLSEDPRKRKKGEALKKTQEWLRQIPLIKIRPQILNFLHTEKIKLEKRKAEILGDTKEIDLSNRIEFINQQIFDFKNKDVSQRLFSDFYHWGAFIISGNPQ